jgi:hypothetical protein
METKFAYLLQVIQLAAADYEIQIQSFPNFVHVPDEIAILLADSIFILDEPGLPELAKTGVIDKIRELDQYFINLPKEKFTFDALQTSQDWEKARQVAKSILDELGLEKEKPNLDWVKFIKNSK